MYKRTITGTISKYNNTDLKPGGFAIFTVETDTGPALDGFPRAARLSVSEIRCYATSAFLAIRFDGSDGDTVAITNELSGTNAVHAEDFTLSDLAVDLVTAEPSSVYLCVVATAGTGNKINFREGCTFSLEIDYTLPPELLPYTDPTLQAGVTQIKAVHMQELRTNINLQRDGFGISPYPFATIRAGYTSLADWTAHVMEMRAAIDEIGVPHEDWLAISVNRPTAAVIEQLRRVVEAIK